MHFLIRNIYFHGRIAQNFKWLIAGRIMMRAALGLVSLFLPIFLFEILNFNFYLVLGFYALSSLLYAFLVGFGVKFLNKIGLKKSLIFSIFIGSLYWGSYYLIDLGLSVKLLFISIALLVIFRIMFWIPYHTDFAKFTNKTNRGKQLSFIFVFISILNVVMPLLSGFIISRFNFGVVFILALLFYLLAIIPFLKISRTNERFVWSYYRTWKEFFSKKRRRVVAAYMADGAESAVAFVVWPIFMWKLLSGDYFQLGALLAMIVFATIILQLVVGIYADKIDKNKMLHIGSILYSIGWIIKIFIFTAFQIFITSTYHSLARIFLRTPFDTINYEIAADQGHYVDEYTVIHEMAMYFGMFIMLIFSGAVFFFFDIQWTFVLAAFTVLLFNFLHTGMEFKET